MKLLTKQQIFLGNMIFSSTIYPQQLLSVNVQMTRSKTWSDFMDQLKLSRVCLPDREMI